VPGPHPSARGQVVDGGRVHGGVGLEVEVEVEVEVTDPLVAGKSGGFDPAYGAAPVPVVALGEQQLSEEPAVSQLFLFRGGEHLAHPGAHRGQTQSATRLLHRGLGCFLGHPAATPHRLCRRGRSRRGLGHDTCPALEAAVELAPAVGVRRVRSSS